MPRTYADLLKEARATIKEVTPAQVGALQPGGAAIVDVREASEWEQGHLPDAIHISKSYVEQQIENAVPDRDTPVILYCAGGVRSLFAAQSLEQLGYTNVASMSGGFQAWKSQGLPWEAPVVLSSDQKQRYSRHLLIPEVGAKGQQRLLESKALLIGAGGLGSPAALYLAAAGVGTIGIVDFDVVDLSNLQRQILHTNDRVGERKVESARKTLNALNPDVKVIPINERLSSENVMRIIKDYDIVINGCDNFPTRYLINDACVMAKKPLVDGSIFQFEGQATVFYPDRGPCYRCLFPEPPPPGAAPSCAEAGVLGVLPGLVGCVQALEAMKLILGAGRPLIGRMMHFDTLSSEVRVLKLRRDPNCLVCSDHPKITELIDYEEFCGLRNPSAAHS